MLIPDQLLPTTIRRADVERTLYLKTVPPGTTIEMVLDPDYWAHLARGFRVNDEIQVVAQDGTFEVGLRVVAIDTRGYWAQTRVLREWRADQPGTQDQPVIPTWPDKDGYTVEFNRYHQWRIINRTQHVVRKGYATEADAIADLPNIKSDMASVQPPAAA